VVAARAHPLAGIDAKPFIGMRKHRVDVEDGTPRKWIDAMLHHLPLRTWLRDLGGGTIEERRLGF